MAVASGARTDAERLGGVCKLVRLSDLVSVQSLGRDLGSCGEVLRGGAA